MRVLVLVTLLFCGLLLQIMSTFYGDCIHDDSLVGSVWTVYNFHYCVVSNYTISSHWLECYAYEFKIHHF